jgi:hypothetical protein
LQRKTAFFFKTIISSHFCILFQRFVSTLLQIFWRNYFIKIIASVPDAANNTSKGHIVSGRKLERIVNKNELRIPFTKCLPLIASNIAMPPCRSQSWIHPF